MAQHERPPETEHRRRDTLAKPLLRFEDETLLKLKPTLRNNSVLVHGCAARAPDDPASMRPRLRASMRLRVFPAEDYRAGGRRGGPHHASMRPRVFPAEDSTLTKKLKAVREASMRPRVFPAEDAHDGIDRAREVAGLQ